MNPTVDAGRSRVALVTDGEQRAALAAVRSLGAAGYTVIVVSSRKRSIAGVSRFARHHITIPSALRESERFLDKLDAVVRAHAVDVIIPITEESLLSVLSARTRFSETVVPFASLEQFERISNKATLL